MNAKDDCQRHWIHSSNILKLFIWNDSYITSTFEQARRPSLYQVAIALCNKSNGRCDIKAEKREELESKSSHKSDIWPPAASKNEVKYTENTFFRL